LAFGAAALATAIAAIEMRSGQSGRTLTFTALHRITSDKGLSVDPTVSEAPFDRLTVHRRWAARNDRQGKHSLLIECRREAG
jgi:hypothetical protein